MSSSFATPQTVARQAPLSMGFPRQEYWSGLLFPSPGDLSNSGIELKSPALQADSLTTELWRKFSQLYLDCIRSYVSSRFSEYTFFWNKIVRYLIISAFDSDIRSIRLWKKFFLIFLKVRLFSVTMKIKTSLTELWTVIDICLKTGDAGDGDNY